MTKTFNWSTLTSRAAAGLVAGIAGFASYNHIVKVAKQAGEATEVSLVLPLSIDGLIVVGTMAMLDDKRHNRKPRLSARVALAFGVIATLAANVASAQPSVKARLVAAVPAVAFLIAVEVLARTGRPLDEPPPVVDDEADVNADPLKPVFLAPVMDPWDYATPIGPEPERVDSLSTPQPPARKPQPSSKERVEKAHKRTPSATNEELAKRLNLSTKTVQRYRPERPAEEPEQVDKPINGHEPQLAVAAP